MTERDVVVHLIADCKLIVDYYVDNAKLPGDGKKVIRDAMYARVSRLTFSGFGSRVPFNWLGVRKKDMGLLDELMQEAKNDVLQEEWDRVLLSAFRDATYPITGFVVGKFMKDNKISLDKFHTLKRAPHYVRHYKTRIPRFIAAYLPALNTKLYDSKMSDDELVAWMNKVNLDTDDLPADRHKANAERKERVRTDKEIAANALAVVFYKGAYGRRQWEQVKAVRNKK